jgi:putative phosphoesterase
VSPKATSRKKAATIEIGVISDTHGLLRPEACRAFDGVSRILHAGDIGDPEVLAALERLAPVTAVTGNNDRGHWTRSLPQTVDVRVGSVTIVMTHILASLGDPGGASVVVYGHSHKPENVKRGRVLYFNPGSAGPRRFKLPVTVGRLRVQGRRVEGEIIDLQGTGRRVYVY